MAQVIDTTAISGSESVSTSKYASGEFFEFLWRTAGIQYVGFFIITTLIDGYQPGIGSSAGVLTEFYGGHGTWVLLGAALGAFNLLNLLWFAAAVRTALAETGQDGWGSAATAASSAFGVLTILTLAIGGILTFSIAGSGNQSLVLGMNDLSWAITVLMSFPRAMLIMSGVFGFWRAGLISNAIFTVGVVGVVLGVLGGFTGLSAGILAPDGIYTRFVSPALLLIWALGMSRILLSRSPAKGAGW
jgi:hypothetical protein